MTGTDYTITRGDTFELIAALPDNSIDLLVTSPPYNIGKVYETRADFKTYLKPYVGFAEQVFAKLAPTGCLCWEVGNYVQAGEVYPLASFSMIFSRPPGLRDDPVVHQGRRVCL